MVKDGKIDPQNVEKYKNEHPISPEMIYQDMFDSYEQYPEVMEIFKLSLLIPPSTASVERGFSILNLVHTKQRNRLEITYRNMQARRIEL